MHDGWLRFCRMKDCFVGLYAGGSWLTSCSAIGSFTLNSSSSSSKLSLGFYRIVHSISVSIGRMVEFLDRSTCMKQMRFCSIAASVLLFGWFLELRSIIPICALDRNALDHSRAKLDCNNINYIAVKCCEIIYLK